MRVVAVGGATLGGSGKTPLAIACARALAERGERVALVGHAYRASPVAARVVGVDDRVSVVGDEALVAARALAGLATVVVGPTRQSAIDLACARADVLVLDGVLQTAPRRASLSVLALDEAAPWGAGRVVPAGDLRAPRDTLTSAADLVVTLGDADARAPGALARGQLVPWAALSHLRLGVFVALSRPERLIAFLGRRGVRPARVIAVPDHGLGPRRVRRAFAQPGPSCDLWLATEKCATHLEAAGIDHHVIPHALALPARLRAALAPSHETELP